MLELYFSTGSEPRLQRIRFFHPLIGHEIQSVRGRTSGAFEGCSSFQWTAGIKAFSLLCLKAVVNHSDFSDTDAAILQGGRGSLAASLDYAISKEPLWTCEVFGSDSNGHTLLRRMIRRSNPERKKGHIVYLSLNSLFLAPEKISIFLGSIQVQEPGPLSKLISQIEPTDESAGQNTLSASQLCSSGKVNGGNGHTTNTSEEAFWELHRSTILSEAQCVLDSTDIFTRQTVVDSVKRLRANALFKKVAGSKVEILPEISLNISSRRRLGYTRGSLESQVGSDIDLPIRFALASTNIGGLVILFHMKNHNNLPIEIDYEYPVTQEIIKDILEGKSRNQPDCCIISIACAAKLLGSDMKSEYKPLMFMPKSTHKPCSSQSSMKSSLSSDSNFILLTDEISTSTMILYDLLESGLVKKNTSHSGCVEPDEIPPLFASSPESLQTIMWFPHYYFNDYYGYANSSDTELPQTPSDLNILFVHERFIRKKEFINSLDTCIRNAWLELRQSPDLIETAFRDCIAPNSFYTSFSRACGLHSMIPNPQPNLAANCR